MCDVLWRKREKKRRCVRMRRLGVVSVDGRYGRGETGATNAGEGGAGRPSTRSGGWRLPRFARSAFGACCVVAGSAHRGLDPVAEGFSAARRRRVAVLRPHGAKGFSGEGPLRWAGPTGADKRRSTSGHASMVWPATIAALVVIR